MNVLDPEHAKKAADEVRVPAARRLLQQMLAAVPKERCTAAGALELVCQCAGCSRDVCRVT